MLCGLSILLLCGASVVRKHNLEVAANAGLAETSAVETPGACDADEYLWDSKQERCRTDVNDNGKFDRFAPSHCCAVSNCADQPYWFDDKAGKCRADANLDGRFDLFVPEACCKCKPDTPYEWDGRAGRCRTDTDSNGVFDQFASTACCHRGDGDGSLLEQAVEQEFFGSWACGSGDKAADECVSACLDAAECRSHPAVVSALLATELLDLALVNALGEQQGYAFAANSPCASFYGDDLKSAAKGFTKTWSRKSSHCAPGEYASAKCIDGRCKVFNEKQDGVNNHACGTKAECATKCMEDKTCAAQVVEHRALQEQALAALELYCVKQEEVTSDWFPKEKSKCFFTPGHACTDKCRDGFRCHRGQCVGVQTEAPALQ